MIKDYSKGNNENLSLHIAIDWDKVYSLTLSKEEVLSELRLEDLSQKELNFSRGKNDYISKWTKNAFTSKPGKVRSYIDYFPSRKIYVENKEVWNLKVNGDIIVRSENYDMIKSNYDHFNNEWKMYKEQKSSNEPS